MLKWFDNNKSEMLMDYSFENCSTYQIITVAEKNIYIFDSHNMALPVWGTICSRSEQKLNLVAFDHHTDTRAAFTAEVCSAEGLYSAKSDVINDFLSSIHYKIDDFCFEDVWKLAVSAVRYDEQILTAYRMGYLASYHIICNLDTDEASDFEREDRNKYNAYYYSRDYIPANLDTLVDSPVALDVDLDYIESQECVKEEEKTTLKRLFSRADAVTIAREPECFEQCKKSQEFTNDQALNLVLEIFRECEVDSKEGVSP